MASQNSINNTITNNNFTVPAGNITASGNISSTAAALSAATTITAGTGLTVTTGPTTINSGASTINIGTDAVDKSINIGFAAANIGVTVGVQNGTSSLNLFSGTGNTQILSLGSGTFACSNGISIDAASAAIDIGTGANAQPLNLGTGAAAKVVTLGSTNSTSQTVIQSGSTGISVATSTNGPISVTSGTGAINLSNDASATTVNLGTGAAAKTVTVGSTNGASLLALRYGTADFTLASATGTVVNALDSGEITMPLQPAFLAQLAATRSNVTGDGTTYTIVWGTEVFDQGGDWDNTSTFTAPVTGRYQFNLGVLWTSIGALHTNSFNQIATSNRNYIETQGNPTVNASGGVLSKSFSVFTDMDSGDTATASSQVSGSTLTVNVGLGGATDPRSYFSGFLAC